MDEQGTGPVGTAADDGDTGADPAVTHDPWSSFDAWAQNASALLALLGGLAFLLLAGPALRAGPWVALLVVASVALAIGPLGAVILALHGRASWARPAAAAVLWAIVIAAVIQVVTDLLVPKLTIPLGAILALAVLSRRPSERPAVGRRDRRIALALGGVYVLTGVLGGVATFLASPPAALVADMSDLQLGITTNCGDPAFLPGQTDVEVSIVWAWTRRDVLPGIDDAFQLEWPQFTGLTKTAERGIIGGGIVIDPSGPAASALDGTTGSTGMTPYARYGLSGVSAAAATGSMRVVFAWERSGQPEDSDFLVRWAHGTRWTTLAMGGCGWPVDAEASPEPSTAP